MIRPDFDENLFPHWKTIPIRFRDLDPLNHVNNAIFSTYYEEARINFIQQVPGFANQLQEGFSFVLANIKIDFVRPAEYPGDLLVGSGIKKLGNTGITSFQAIYSDESKKLISVAEAFGVWFSLERQRPARIPEINDREKLMIDKALLN
ncbi:MAG: thioesterase family protein [Balneolaceae bacterium]|nr:thioesterase family protein [Balneolaceae bacterium]